MKLSSNTRHCALILFAGLIATTTTGCASNWMKKGIDKADLIPAAYPQSGLRVGALVWGKPGEPPKSIRFNTQVLSDSFIEEIPAEDAAFINQSKSYERIVKVAASPGPEFLKAIQSVSVEAGVEFQRSNSKQLDWGELKQQSVDLDRLSNAIVRGWYNMPGDAVDFEALSALDLETPKAKNRPYFIQRAVWAKGLTYEVSKETVDAIRAGASEALYGSAEAEVSVKTGSSTALQINKPMTIGYDTVSLVKVEPGLPLSLGVSVDDLSEHVFTWKLGSGGTIKKAVRPIELKLIAKRNAIEEKIEPAVVQNLNTQLSQAQPARVGIAAEARSKAANATWRGLAERDTFRGDELVRLRLNLQDPAYVYILAMDSDGKAVVMYPRVDGESISTGQDSLLPVGEWTFPSSVANADGMVYDPMMPAGTESFLVVASKTQQAGLPTALAAFAKSCRDTAARNPATTRGADFSLLGATRVPVGLGSAAGSAAPTTTPSLPAFVGVGSATVLTVNLRRVPAQ